MARGDAGARGRRRRRRDADVECARSSLDAPGGRARARRER